MGLHLHCRLAGKLTLVCSRKLFCRLKMLPTPTPRRVSPTAAKSVLPKTVNPFAKSSFFGKNKKGAPDCSDAPQFLAVLQRYCNGATAPVQVARPPPLGWKRTTASSNEQKLRTPLWFREVGLASAW